MAPMVSHEAPLDHGTLHPASAESLKMMTKGDGGDATTADTLLEGGHSQQCDSTIASTNLEFLRQLKDVSRPNGGRAEGEGAPSYEYSAPQYYDFDHPSPTDNSSADAWFGNLLFCHLI
jgi:hypothetical protein